MKKFFSILVLTSVLFGTAGCGNKKKNKAVIEQNPIVIDTSRTDKKEDYSIVA